MKSLYGGRPPCWKSFFCPQHPIARYQWHFARGAVSHRMWIMGQIPTFHRTYFSVFQMEFGLRREAPFVSSPIHLLVLSVANSFCVLFYYYAPAPVGEAGALGGHRRLSSVYLSDVAYIGSNSKTKRPRKTKLCTGLPQVTCDSHTDFKVKSQGGRGHIVAAT